MRVSTPDNLASLLVDRAHRHPRHRLSVLPPDPGTDPEAGAQTAADVVELGGRIAAALGSAGVGPGRRVALIGTTTHAYLLCWIGLQLAGAEVALVNPTYPAQLLTEMLRPLEPRAVLWVGRDIDASVAPRVLHLDGTSVAAKGFDSHDGPLRLPETGDHPGAARRPLDIAGWMHTSGTTGVPKFCTQTHEYFLRLGRFVADSLALTETDVVFAPLPLFHINPLGYGVIGGLVGHSQVLGWERFSARRFWPGVRDLGVTTCILHAPPVEILKRACSPEDAQGHQVRAVLFADGEFLDRFAISLALSVYGSTEAGGLTHTWAWRRGEETDLPEGMSRYGGRPRGDIDWAVAHDGEILVRGERPGVLFSGYLRADGLDPALDGDGWFHTGDLGRIDERGNLVFIERAAEAIRVKGEYVPIGFVEQRFQSIDGLDDLALWRRTADVVDYEPVLYVSAPTIPIDAVMAAAADLPVFMRPTAVLRVDGPLPRDAGVGKVRRRSLESLRVVEEARLEYCASQATE